MYTATINVIVGDTSFTPPLTSATFAGAGTFQSSVGSNLTMNWFADAANTQGAIGGALPGVKISTYTSPTITSIVEGIGYTSPLVAVNFAGPFSLTEQTVYTLKPGGQIINRGESVIFAGVPEASTWAMMLLGFAGIGLAGNRRLRKSVALSV